MRTCETCGNEWLESISVRCPQCELTNQSKEGSSAYRAVFLRNPTGTEVLLSMLYDLHYFSRCDTPEETALCNYAKHLVAAMGPADVFRGLGGLLSGLGNKKGNV